MAKSKKLDKGAYNSLLLAAAMWGFVPLFYKQSLLSLGIAVFLLLRFSIGAAYLFVTNKKLFVRLSWKIGAAIGILCIIDNLLANITYSYGIQRTTVLHASMIMLSLPFFVYFFAAILLREKVHTSVVVGGIISVTGLLFIVLSGGQSSGGFTTTSVVGDLAILIEVIMTALGVVFARKLLAKNKVSSEQLAFTEYTLAAVLFFIFVLLNGSMQSISSMGAETWVWVIGAGVLVGAVPMRLYYSAARRLPASRLADSSFISPVVAAAVGILFLNEALTASYIIGASVVVIGLLIGHRKIHPVLIAHKLRASTNQLQKVYRIPQKAYQYIRYDD